CFLREVVWERSNADPMGVKLIISDVDIQLS